MDFSVEASECASARTAVKRVGIAVLIVLILVSLAQDYEKRADCREKLKIPPAELRENPERINRLLKECNYANVRILTREEYRKDWNQPAKVQARAKFFASLNKSKFLLSRRAVNESP